MNATVEAKLAEVRKRLDRLVECQETFLTEERQHRIERRRREAILREANPKLPTPAIELLLESDTAYLFAFNAWHRAQVARKRAEGEYEIAKMAAWSAIRMLG